jgi:type III secretion protein T
VSRLIELTAWFGSMDAFSHHAKAIAACSARILPVVFLCPFLGGQAAPATVRLTTVLAMAIGLHVAGGVGAEVAAVDLWATGALVLREMALGTGIGLIASLPFDAARIGGRFVDLFRGTSAEAVLPVSGTRESAAGDGLYQLVVALAIASGAAGAVAAALWRSFGALPLGGFAASEGFEVTVVRCIALAFTSGLAIGAPVAALSLCVDALLGFASRAAPQIHLSEVGAPLRILGGGALLWLSVGWISQRLLELANDSSGWIGSLLAVSR